MRQVAGRTWRSLSHSERIQRCSTCSRRPACTRAARRAYCGHEAHRCEAEPPGRSDAGSAARSFGAHRNSHTHTHARVFRSRSAPGTELRFARIGLAPYRDHHRIRAKLVAVERQDQPRAIIQALFRRSAVTVGCPAEMAATHSISRAQKGFGYRLGGVATVATRAPAYKAEGPKCWVSCA